MFSEIQQLEQQEIERIEQHAEDSREGALLAQQVCLFFFAG